MLKHYVEIVFLRPMRVEQKEVQERDKETIDFPEGAMFYRFYDRNELIAEDKEVLIGHKKNFSKYEFCDKELEDLLIRIFMSI